MRYVRPLAVIIVIICIFSSAFAVVDNSTKWDGKVSIDIDEVGSGVFHIDYKTDYHLREYMTIGGADMSGMYDFVTEYVCEGHDPRFEPTLFGCSLFNIKNNEGDDVLARNFDFFKVTPCVVTTSPSDGYSSVSVTTLRMFGYDGQTLDEMRANDYTYRAAAYVPMDGLNEKGIAVSINAVHNMPDGLDQDTGRTRIFTTTVLRMILDYASTIEEAKQIIERYDMVSTGQSVYHIFISDAEGNGLAVEFKGNDIAYTETNVMTNHYLDEEMGKNVDITESSMNRYASIVSDIIGKDSLSDSEILNVISKVAQRDDPITHYTQWTCIYNNDEHTLEMYYLTDFSKGYYFEI